MPDTSKIKDRDSLLSWLNTLEKRQDWILFLASRSALRIAPQTLRDFHYPSQGLDRADVRIWRTLPIPLLALARPTLNLSLQSAIKAVFDASSDADGAAYSEGTVASTYGEMGASAFGQALRSVKGDHLVAAVSCATWFRGELWQRVREDITFLDQHNAKQILPLCFTAGNQLRANWMGLKDVLRQRSDYEDLVFWVDWYEAQLDGRPMLSDINDHWEMLVEIFEVSEVSRFKEEDWDKGASHINPLIREIYEDYKAQVNRKSDVNSELFVATLFDFTYDKIEAVMRAVPIEGDWKTLEDEDRLDAFLDDAEDLRHDLALMCAALEAEGGAMQGGAGVRTYADAILATLSKADEIKTLRVDKLMEYGRILEAAARNEDTLREFSTVGEALKINAEKLRMLIRNHFAHTLARMAVLRDIHLEPDASPWQVLQEFREIVEQVQSGGNGKLPPLAAMDAVVLTDVLDSVDVLVRSMETTQSDEALSSFQKEIDFQLAKVGATAEIYKEKASRAVGKTGDAADTAIKWNKRWDGLRAFGQAVRELFENGN